MRFAAAAGGTMKKGLVFWGALASVSVASSSLAAPDALPLRTVRFYETGVAYFERSGVLHGDGAARGVPLTLPLPTAQLDDALKSLVVISSDGKARLSGIEFESTVGPDLGRALAGLDSEGQSSLDWTRLLRSMKGADVVVRASRETIRGRLVDVLDASADESTECVVESRSSGGPVPVSAPAAASAPSERCVPTRRASLVLLGDDGGVRRFRAPEVASVKPVDAALASRLRTALGSASPANDQRARGVRVLGTSGSPVTLGYVTETPVWRSTYRVLFQKNRAHLQGWALVHNDTDEAWRGVKVELVNGRPDAFLYPLAAPRYARRDLVHPETPLSTVPQLLETGSPDRQWGGAGGLGLSGVGEGGGGRGEGIGLGSIGTIGRGAGRASGGDGARSASTELSVGDLAGVAGATGVEAEALFRYSLDGALDLAAHSTALVPFVSKPLAATRITWFREPGDSGRSGARLKNDTKQTLPAGTIAFFADGGFAGETLLDRMKPDEVRVVGFGLDQDVSLSLDDRAGEDETRRVHPDGKGGLIVDYVRHRNLECTIENRSSGDREVYFTLPVVDNAKVEGADGLDYDQHEKRALARFSVAKKSSLTRSLVVQEGMRQTRVFGSLTADAVQKLASALAPQSGERAALVSAVARLRNAENERRGVAELLAAEKSAATDVERARQNLAAAGSSAGAAPFAERLVAAEDALRAARSRLLAAQHREAAAVEAARVALSSW